jgi:hypothetical protein
VSDKARVPICVSFTQEDNEKMMEFYAVNGWERWAAAHSVQPVTKYAKYKFTFAGDSFTMIQMIAGTSVLESQNTYTFDTLQALKDAELHEEIKYAIPSTDSPAQDLGVLATTFTRR